MNPKKETRKIIDELCTCGHKRSEHGHSGLPGHGPCRECFCPQYRWKRFIFARRKPQEVV